MTDRQLDFGFGMPQAEKPFMPSELLTMLHLNEHPSISFWFEAIIWTQITWIEFVDLIVYANLASQLKQLSSSWLFFFGQTPCASVSVGLDVG